MLKMDSWALNGLDSRVAGRLLLRQLYEELTGQETLPEIGKGQRGKPCFLTGPYHFSITHTKTRVFCAISDRPIGIDAEDLTRRVNPELADKILSDSERAIYDASAPEDKNEVLLRLWVMKEAAVKCSGEGLRGYPNQTDFRPDDPRIMLCHGCVVAVIEGEEDAV